METYEIISSSILDRIVQSLSDVNDSLVIAAHLVGEGWIKP